MHAAWERRSAFGPLEAFRPTCGSGSYVKDCDARRHGSQCLVHASKTCQVIELISGSDHCVTAFNNNLYPQVVQPLIVT